MKGRWVNIGDQMDRFAPLCSLPRLVLVSVILGTLSACGGLTTLLGPEPVDIGPTLRELQPARMPDVSATIPETSLDQIEAGYRRALEVADDPSLRRKVLVRLAGLEMTRAEQRQVAATEAGQRYFDKAIALYQELIDLYGEESDVADESIQGRDELIYQLAKAYALDGRMEASARVLARLTGEQQTSPLYSSSAFQAEAHFRRAERAFSLGDYMAAGRGYQAVMAQGPGSSFYNNAVYMYGWSLFKRGRYQESLKPFTQVLDGASAEHGGDLGEVTGPWRSLVVDTLHVMSLVFSYLDGATTIGATYDELGERPYNHQLYQHLGDLFLEKRRYRDSAETFKHYVEKYPGSDWAPAFHVRMIDVYTKGNFPSLLLPAKESYVHNYGLYSDYWKQKTEVERARLRPHLHTFIDELAKYEHAQAQMLEAQLTREGKNQKTVLNKVEGKVKVREKIEAAAVQKFLLAARWYREFAETFPDDEQTPNRVFLMAESLNEAGQWEKAFNAYQKVAYHYRHPVHGAEAGYAAILSAETLLKGFNPETQSQQIYHWKLLKTQSALSYSQYYADDKRAPAVLTQAAQELLAQGQPDAAIAAATRITQWQPRVAKNLRQTAWLVLGQSQFDSARFARAEQAYRQVLALLPARDPSRDSIIERVAASVYQGAGQLLAADNKAAAVEQLLRIRELAPSSDIAVTGQYDAINYLIELQDWPRAQQELLDFRRRYPQNQLIGTLPPKLVVVYEKQQDWIAAADELSDMSTRDGEPEVKRQSLYLAAEYYEKAGDIATAILRYRQYAHSYAEPFDQVMEARFKMSELYASTGETEKRKFWLRKLVKGDAEARTDRSRYLGAFARSELAEDSYREFVRIPLKLPLKNSLTVKKAALKQALKAYEAVLAYEMAEFTTQANYRIGAIYSQLSRDLMASQRPGNMDELALEQYDILLEEQAFPFEELAIEIHQSNAQRSWDGIYDQWVKRSFDELQSLLPGRYDKREQVLDYAEGIY